MLLLGLLLFCFSVINNDNDNNGIYIVTLLTLYDTRVWSRGHVIGQQIVIAGDRRRKAALMHSVDNRGVECNEYKILFHSFYW